MSKTRRTLSFRVNSDLELRTEIYNGREHLVVPVIALVETVVFAGNADAPEFVPKDELTDMKFVASFNGRPIFSGHPQNEDGEYLMGNQPSVLDEKQIGTVFNALASDGKLKVEAWLDVDRVKSIEPELLERIEDDDPRIEVSVGVYVDTEAKTGVHKGKKYSGVWHNLVPDHLAILPSGEIGACSVAAGCGVRAAHSKGSDMKINETRFFRSAVSREQMSDNDVRRKLYDALRAKLGPMACGWVEAVYDTLVVYTTFDDAYEVGMYRSEYSLSENGVVTLGEDAKKVEPRTVYDEVSQESEPRAAEHSCSCKSKRTADTGETLMKNISDALKKNLEAATPEQIAAVEKVFTAPVVAETKVETPAAETKVEETPAAETKVETPAAAETKVETPVVATAAEVKEPTLDELLAKATPDVRAAYDASVKAAATAKATAIKTLRDSGRCDMSDAELNAKSQAELDILVKLASANLSLPAQTDFSGNGVPVTRAAEQPATEVEAPQDIAVAIRAARGVK